MLCIKGTKNLSFRFLLLCFHAENVPDILSEAFSHVHLRLKFPGPGLQNPKPGDCFIFMPWAALFLNICFLRGHRRGPFPAFLFLKILNQNLLFAKALHSATPADHFPFLLPVT